MKMSEISAATKGYVPVSQLVKGDELAIVNEGQVRDIYDPREKKMKKIYELGVKIGAIDTYVNLNASSKKYLKEAFGDDTRDWVGQTAIVDIEEMNIAGKKQLVTVLKPKGYKAKQKKLESEN